MAYRVAIKDNKTGEVRVTEHKGRWREGSAFNWLEGNFSCDCNRELFFRRAGGEDPDLDDTHCSDNRFSVEYVEFAEGKHAPEDLHGAKQVDDDIWWK